MIHFPNGNHSLKEVEALYGNLLETLPAIVYLAEAKPPFATTFVSAGVNILGYTVDEWLSSSDFWATIIHASDREWVLEKNEAAMKEQGSINLEYRVYGKGGKVFWLHEVGKYVLGKDGKTICRQGVFIDITLKKIAEIEREKLLAKLQAALAEIKTLNGLIPICTYCSKVRNDKNYWQDVEKYMSERLTSKFSNSICPDCFQNVKNRLNGITQKLHAHVDHQQVDSHI